ncbi:E3 SUMO-protein ligase ZBED1-like [Adelges cooleyi]|uniref:E3 SUMO-protein ligase ZBED1-like n=1 Tax=Adelges cooleyi TaxID=133065 RepID=UPI0021800A1A|nr:E3 SUMO-protein ligase ZBED1-like [Adelges cooleyi]
MKSLEKTQEQLGKPNLTLLQSSRQIASFLDPRYKDLEYEALECRETIRSKVKELVEAEIVSTKDNAEQEKENVQKTNALAFIYQKDNRSIKDAPTQFAGYLSEPQLQFDLNPFEWWKAREEKYPVVAAIAKKYLSIPATSASSERCFSTAGNIVTSKRNCLNPENVNMLAFLYQNKGLYI